MRLRDKLLSGPTLAFLVLVTPQCTSAFYVPGVVPTTYAPGDRVQLDVNHLTPGFTNKDSQLHSVLAYDYYHPAFHFCQPENGPEMIPGSLGSTLFGDRILTSPFELHMAQNESCKALCTSEKIIIDAESAKFVNERIAQNYNINWIIDGLPAAQVSTDAVSGVNFYSPGFALGMNDDIGESSLNNHFDILVDYHKIDDKHMRVVGILVEPYSRRDATVENGRVECGDPRTSAPLILNQDGETPVTWTYGVFWKESPTAWATRWDKYLHVFDPKIQWFSLINSAVIVVFLTGMVASILVRTLRKDIARYNRLDQINLDDLSGASALDEGVQEDSGWKLIHGDVFRTPSHPLLLSIFLGSGAQLFMMTGVTIIFALLGFLSPSNRGYLSTIMVILYTLFGGIGGYVSARVYKSFGGEAWKQNIALTPMMVPGVVFGTFFLLNLFLWAKGASGAVPFGTMLVLVSIWFLISVPLSVVGSWLGFKQPAVSPPVRTNQIPRQIPPSATYLRPIPSTLLVGILPYGAIFVELSFIMRSIWFSRFFYMFGFLFVCYGLMIITCAAVTILTVYFLLCSENYHWHWRAFFTSGASTVYVFASALLYWATRASLGGVAGNVLYLGYSALISFLFFILTGTIGFLASWAFVQKIYGSIKVD
ncbi:MAG: hypothetical protein M1817_002012 [Caeruleum heppii]|nr:MAG: hypothetical protein M1817_002012 [Caeruleum heppii]